MGHFLKVKILESVFFCVKGDCVMLKVRIQGKIGDIKKFVRQLNADNRLELVSVSDIYDNKGSQRYKHLYMDVDYKVKGGKKVG